MSGVTDDALRMWCAPHLNSFYVEQTMEKDGTRSYEHKENPDGMYYYLDRRSNIMRIGELFQ